MKIPLSEKELIFISKSYWKLKRKVFNALDIVLERSYGVQVHA